LTRVLAGAVVPIETIQQALASVVQKLMQAGRFHKPEFRVNPGRLVLPDNADERGIEWGGDYADWDEKGLASAVQPGDPIRLAFLHNDGMGDIAGEIHVDTATMKVRWELEG